MTYDTVHLESIIKKLKSSFIIRLIILSALAMICLLLILLSVNDETTVISGIVLFVTCLLFMKLYDKYNPKVLFSKEIKGINIKENEYEIMKRGSHKGGTLRHKQVGGHGIMPYAPNSRQNRKAFHKNMHFSGEVYLKSDDGNIHLVTGLYGSHIEIYGEGDILLKPEGCKFPVVLSRETDRQPCPVCGEINGEEREMCSGCGLKILSKGEQDEYKI